MPVCVGASIFLLLRASLLVLRAPFPCRKTIDDFLEMLPLFQALTSKAMRERHWTEVMKITGHDLNLAEDTFKLQVGAQEGGQVWALL